jgi:cytochrome c peroxidase
MFARAIAEFEFALVFADAPIDRFARGDRSAMTLPQKKGASCSSARRDAFPATPFPGSPMKCSSDFAMHVAGVPQIAPFLGVDEGNVIFDVPVG